MNKNRIFGTGDKLQERKSYFLAHTKNTFVKEDILDQIPNRNNKLVFSVLKPSNEQKLMKDGFQKCNLNENSSLKEMGIEILEGTAIAVLTGKRKIKIYTLNGNWVKALPYNG